jgi:H+/Cl- antiporter ClcA
MGSWLAMFFILGEVLPFIKTIDPHFGLLSFSMFAAASLAMPFCAVVVEWDSILKILIIVPLVLLVYLACSYVMLKNQDYFYDIFSKIISRP